MSRSRSDRHWDGQVDSPVKKSDENDLFMKEKKPTEELEDEQKKLDEEMERRRRRVQQWLEFRRKKKETEGEKHREVDVDEPNSVKTWTLEGESDDEERGMDVDGEAYRTDKEDEAVLEVDSENETAAPALQDHEIDPLDAFIILRIIPGEDSDSDYGDIENNDNPLEDEDDDEFTKKGAARVAAIAVAMNLKHNLAKIQADAMPEHFEAELEINDIPQNARWKVTHKETLGPISDLTGAAITIRGQYFPPGKVPGPGDCKVFLFIDGLTEQSVNRGKAEIKRKSEEIMNQALPLSGGAQQRRYQAV
ncbi:hypothetical protein C1H46_035882 [Malus baccata]|uniref:ATP-dependent RNA helicase PRP5/DDX46/KHDC4 KH domain-containing protein n=1 Tax=Malus baccata TaxID=106549 RepID=A0A540KWF8_MALBA|nr:hypothetical protein C1H46_035882 [Malus baccata]